MLVDVRTSFCFAHNLEVQIVFAFMSLPSLCLCVVVCVSTLCSIHSGVVHASMLDFCSFGFDILDFWIKHFWI